MKLVMNIHAREKPIRAQHDTVSMKRQPSLSGRPSGRVPRSQMQAQRLATVSVCFPRRGNHFFQNSLLHLPLAPSSEKWKYHAATKRAVV